MRRIVNGLAGLVIAALAVSPLAAFAVYGEIAGKWRALGASAGVLGVPRSDEAAALDGGRINAFQNGFVTWHPKYGVHAVYGLIGATWNALGRERGIGYPLTDEMPGAKGGRFNDFSNNATIDFHPKAGTHVVVGLIRLKWLAMGREGGACGYPVTDETAIPGGRRSGFQFGSITWLAGRPAAVAQCGTKFDDGPVLVPASS